MRPSARPRQIVHRPAERRERSAARLVGHRHGHLAAAGECLQERPLRAGQVLEAVREDRLAAPGVELSGDTFRRMPAQEIAVPHAEPVELPAICGIQRRELALEVVRVEQAGLELTHRREQRVCEAAETGRAAEAVERLAGECAADDESTLRLGRHRTRIATAAGESPEKVVEGADRAAEQSRLDGQQLTLALLDVRPVRHDQVRLTRQRLEIPAEQERNLPGVSRAGDEVQTQLTYSSRALRRRPRRRTLRAGKASTAAAFFGRRPRLATAWPGILPAQVSQRSACFEPRRASVKLIRITAPFASSTSLPQSSQTNLVTRATDFLPLKRFRMRLSLAERIRELGGRPGTA